MERVQQVAGWTVIEAPFALFQEEMEMGFWDAIVAAHMPFGLVPKVFNSIDMIVRVSEELGMIDPVMMELRDIQHII